MSGKNKAETLRDRVTSRVFRKTHNNLTKLSEKSGMRIIDIVDYLSDLARDYDLLNPDWKMRAVQKTLDEERQKLHSTINIALQKEKFKMQLSMKRDMLKEFVKTLEGDAKKDFIGNLLGDMNDPHWIDTIGEFAVVLLDGRRRLVKTDNEGKPIFPEIKDRSRVVTCDRGYHTINGFCECRSYNDCDMRIEERVEYHARLHFKSESVRRRTR